MTGHLHHGAVAISHGGVKAIRVLTVVAVAVLASASRADFEEVGTAARPWGTANAYTALAMDHLALYYNPAGLSALEGVDAGVGYNRLWIGLTDQSNLGSGHLAVAMPLRSLSPKMPGVFGLAYLTTYLSNVYSEQTLALGYGFEPEPGYAVGATLKWMSASVVVEPYLVSDPLFAKASGTGGLGADLGVLVRKIPDWNFALFIANVLSPNLAFKGSDAPPTRIKGGVAYRIPGWDFTGDVILEGGDFTVAAGLEKRFQSRTYFVRGGMAWGSREYRLFTLGAGMNLQTIQLDYAFVLPLTGPTGAGSSHKVEMSVRFGEPTTQADSAFQTHHLVAREIYDDHLAKLKQELAQAWSEVERLQKAHVEDRALLDKAIQMTMALSEKLQMVEQEAKRPRIVERVVERPAPPPPKPSRPSTYVVKEGDTLKSIAKAVYGDEGRWVDLLQANQQTIRQGMVIPGQVLKVP